MRYFLFLFLFSCSTNNEIVFEKKFLTHDEIKQEFNSKDLIKADLDIEGTKERKAMLVPMDTFIPKEDKKDLKKNEIEFKDAITTQDSIDLRKWDTPIKKQWNGTCTTFAGVAGIEHLLKSPQSLDLSERDSWSKYKQYSCKAFVDALSKEKICNEKNWPQENEKEFSTCAKERHAKLDKITYLYDSKTKAIEALNNDSPVYVGLRTPNDMLNCSKVVKADSSLADGGHAVIFVGYKKDSEISGGGYFILKNSWGSYCGDHGYQYLPFSYCDRDDVYCMFWEFQKASSLKIPEPIPTPNPVGKKVCKGWWIFKKCEIVY